MKMQYMFTNYIYIFCPPPHFGPLLSTRIANRKKIYLKNQQGSTSCNVILQNLAIFQQEWVDFSTTNVCVL